MAKTKTDNKQISKQNVNVYIGEKAVKRRRGKPRKRRAKGSGFVVQNTFTSPIINYPPNYVNPAVVQPVQQPQLSTLIPKVPAGAPPATQPRLGLVSRATLTDFPEGETAPTLGLDPTKRVKVKVEEEEKPRPVSAFSAFDRRLARESQEAKLASYRAPTPLKKSKAKPQPTAENALGGRDTNNGDQYEPDVGISEFGDEPRFGLAYNLEGELSPSASPRVRQRGITEALRFAQRPVLPPIFAQPVEQVIAEPFVAGSVNIAREKTPPRSRSRKPKGIKPPDVPPPEGTSPSPKRGRGRPRNVPQQFEQGPVEPPFPPPEEAPPVQGISFLGSTRRPTSAPPTIERQREQAIPPTEQANFV